MSSEISNKGFECKGSLNAGNHGLKLPKLPQHSALEKAPILVINNYQSAWRVRVLLQFFYTK